MSSLSTTDRIVAWAKQEKYKIIVGSWAASMIGSFALVGRNPYLSGQQKLVQARVYAQGLTLAVLCASAAFEISDSKKGKGILDPSQKKKREAIEELAEGERGHDKDMWKEMVAAEEQRLKNKHKDLYEHHHSQSQEGVKAEEKEQEGENKEEQKDEKKEEKTEEKTEGKKEEKKEEKTEDKKEEKKEGKKE